MRKRVFAMVLVAALCVSLLPTTAFAEEGEYTVEATEETAETDTQTADIEIAEDGSATIVVSDVDEETESDSVKVKEAEEAVPDESEDVEEAAEEEAEPEETVYTKKDGSIRVEVTAPADALPEGAELSVQRYEKNSKEYRDAAEAIGFEEDQGTDMAAVDISFLLDGEEVEPSEPVKVSIDVSDILPEDTDASTLEVQHLVEKADDTVKPVVVANDSEETEGSIDVKKETAEFEVESFSSFTITWETGNSTTEVIVNVYDMNGLGVYDAEGSFSIENDTILISDLVADHASAGIEGDYTFAYATAQYLNWTSSSGGGAGGQGTVTTIGSETNSVTQVTWSGSNYGVITESGTTTVSASSVTEFYINLYFTTPIITISVTDADYTNHTVSLNATIQYFQNDEDVSYSWEFTDENAYELADIVVDDNDASQAKVVWHEGDDAGTYITVRVTATNDDGEIAVDTFELVYGMQQVTYTVYYGTTGTSGTLASGADVSLLDENGKVVSSGTTGTNGQVTLWVVPGVTYTLEAAYTVSSSSGMQGSSSTHYSYEQSEYVYAGDGTDNTNIYMTVSGATQYEHLDVKLSIAVEDNDAYTDILANVDYVKIYDETGTLVYQSSQMVKNGDTNDYNVIFVDANGSNESHSIVFYDSYTVEIAYEVTYSYADSNGDILTYTETYVSTIDKDTTYVDGEYYGYDGTNAYQLYNAIHGTSYTEATFAAAVAAGDGEGGLPDYDPLGISLDGQNYFSVAAALCDSTGTQQAGVDFALGVNSLRRNSSTTWNFEILKVLTGDIPEDGLTIEPFKFDLYDATVEGSDEEESSDDVWKINVSDNANENGLNFTLSSESTIIPNGDEIWETTMDGFYTFNFDSSMIGKTQTFYFVLLEEKGNETEITYDNTVYGIKIELTLNSATDMTDVTIVETVYELTETESDDEDYRVFSGETVAELQPDTETGYTVFAFANSYGEAEPEKDVDADGDGEYGDNGVGVQVGDTLKYKIDYENAHSRAATVTITDVLEEGLDYVENSASDGGVYDEETRTITWVIEDVEAGASGSVTFEATVNETALVKNEVENTASVQVVDDPFVDTNTVENPVNPETSKDVDIHNDGTYGDNGLPVQVGGSLTYKVDYQNTEDEAVTVTITDVLDEGLDFVEASDGGVYDEETHTITWILENVEAGTSGSVTFEATVNETALVKNEVDNTASVQVGDNPAVETNTVENPVNEENDKDVDIHNDDTYGDNGLGVHVGDTLTYKINYENESDEAVMVIITDVLDEGLDYVEDSASDGGTYDEETRTITWIIDSVEAGGSGSVTFEATVNESAHIKDEVENTALVQVGDNSAVYTNTVHNPIKDKDVDADGDGEFDDDGQSVSVGDTLTYEISYFNSSRRAATVTITDVLDEGLDYVEGSASDGGVYDEETRTITWVFENVAALTGSKVTFQATVNENALVIGGVGNTAEVQAADDPTVDTNTVYNPVPDKDVDIHGDNTYGDSGLQVNVGDTLTYIIYYQNSDDEAATVTITDVLDIGLDFVEASDGGTYNEDTRTITWVIEDVEPHSEEGYYVTFKATVNESAMIKSEVDNTATVQVGDHPEQQTRTVYNPIPGKDVDADGDGYYGDTGKGVQVGDTLTYKISYFNGYDDPATVTITDVLDKGLDFVSASDGGSYDEGTRTITWVIEDVKAHTDGYVTFQATVNENALVKNEVENTAKVQVGDDPDTAVDTNTVYNPVPDKDVDANGDEVYEDSGMQVEVGGTLVYKIDYENPDDEAAIVTITDKLDIGLDFESATDNGSYDESSRTITWVISDVEAHTNGSVYFTATVNENALEAGVVKNTAKVQVGNHAEQQTKTVYNPLTGKDVDADGDGTYGDNGMGVQVGDTLTYEITYFNGNDGEATVTITDVLDEGLDFVFADNGGTYDESTRTVTWVIEGVEAQTAGSVTFQAIVNENALVRNEVENTATVQVGDDSAVETNTVYNPIPDKDVDADGDDEYKDSGMMVEVGDTLVYKIDYENPDDDKATVTITDELDIGLDFMSATDGGSYDESSRTITWVIENVEAHTNGSVYFTATVNEDALEKHEVDNTAVVQVGNHAEQQTKTVYNPIIPVKGVDADGDGEYDDSGMHVEVGDTLTYEIEYKNSHDEAATITITDVLDIGLDFVEASDGGTYDESTRTITWVLDAEANAFGSVYFTATVNEDALEKHVVENMATVQVGDDPAVDTNTTENPLLPDKDVDADGDGEYGDNGLGVQVGDTLTYIVEYRNSNEEPATVTITDVLDKGLDFVSASDGGSYDEGTRTITWVIEDVKAHTDGYVTFEATVNETALVRNEVDNTATVQVDGHPEVQTNTVYNPIPDKDVDADADGEYGDSGMPVRVGDTLTYKIDYENPDDDPATVTITDKLDIGLEFVSADNGGTYDDDTRTITWVIEGVDAHTNGSVTFEATVNESALERNLVDNTAIVQVGDHPEQETRKVENPLGPEKDVDIHNDGTYGDTGLGVKVGDTLTYEITYFNGNDDPATVTITDVLDEGLDFVEASDGGTYDEDSRTITWIIEDAEPHMDGSVTFTATVNETALVRNEVDNTATVQVGDDPETAVDTNTVYNPVPDKDVDADGDGEYKDSGMMVEVGDTLVYKIDYENPDDDPATVTITDELDIGLDYVEATDGGAYDESSRTITWVIEGVEAHTNGSVYFTATVNDHALEKHEVENTAVVQVGEHPAQQTKTVYNPLVPAKGVDADGDGEFVDNGVLVAVGDTLTYEIVYKNSDDEPATVTITDVLDEGLDYVDGSASDGGTYDEAARTITWVLDAEANAFGRVTFQATVNETAQAEHEVENTASVQVGDHPAVDTNTVYNPLYPAKDVDADGDGNYGDSGMQVQVGDTLTYKIDFKNTHDVAEIVTITDDLDEGLDFVSASDGGTYDEENHRITWSLEVEAGVSGSVTFDATVNEKALDKDEVEVENTASVKVGDDPAIDTNTVYNPLKYRQYYPIDEEIVTDEDNIFDRDAWVKDESVNEYNAIEFEMTTMLPKISGEDVANGIFTMRFHEILDHELELDENTADFSVYLYGNTDEPFEVPSEYYVVTINPEETCTIPGENGEPGQEVQCSFHVVVDLTALYNDGLISDEDLQGDTWITIYFFADLEGEDLNGSYTSTIWYEVYDGENLEYTSNVDVVSVYTYEVEINKVDENGDPLAGATFGVYYDENCTDPVLRTMKNDEGDPITTAYTVKSGEDGVVMFYGLAEGTYYVKELAAPTGYVLSDKVITVEPGADTVDEDHIYHTAGVFVNTPSNPDEPQNPLKFVETNGDGDFLDDHLTVNVGDDLTYRIYYYNYNDEAVTVTVKDTLDYALDFVSAKNGGEYDEDSRTITWTVENAAAKTWGYVEFTAKANDLALLQPAIENTASVQIGNDAFVDTNTVENPTPDAEGNPTTGSPKTGTGAPKTGDTNNFGLWLVLLMAAMVGVFAALRMRKRS